MAFDVKGKAPGVYIDEVQVPGPIVGVGTSTAAFVGPARKGDLNTPVLLTSWTQFLNNFAPPPDPQGRINPYINEPPVYVTHAVRGFFENEGTSCYFVRVGTAAQASLPLKDRAGTPQPVLRVTAKNEGKVGNDITVEVADASIATTAATKPAAGKLTADAAAHATTVSVDKAAEYRPGDIVLLDDGGGKSERATIDHLNGTTVTLQSSLVNPYPKATSTFRIADLAPGQTTFRVDNAKGIESGSYLDITPQGGATQKAVVQAVDKANNLLTLSQGLAQNIPMGAGDPVVDVKTKEFTLHIVTPTGNEDFTNLSVNPVHSRYFAGIKGLQDSPNVKISLADPPSSTSPPDNLPAVAPATKLVGGADDDLSQIQPANYEAGVDALKKIDDVNILCVPDRTEPDFHQIMINHCATMKDRFAILDPPRDTTVSGITAHRNSPLVTSDRGYAALYYPWVVVANPLTIFNRLVDPRIKVPPSGHIAGLYARTDGTRGVHKAPANDVLRGVLALEQTLSDEEQGPLNDLGVNVIRAFPGRGIRVWGARTVTPPAETQWRYINVRRLLLFIEESIQEGTQFAVFEPNDIGLWATVKRQVTDFLTRVWRDGALFGATPDDAFKVRVDEELNPSSSRALGILTIEVILYPTTPAEFIIFRIIQQPGGPPTIEE